jgi:hypothetical protein
MNQLIKAIKYLTEREKHINGIPLENEIELRRLFRGIRNLIEQYERKEDVELDKETS